MFRLSQALAPVPTDLVLLSEAPEPISVQGLRVDGEEVLPAGWTPSSAVSASTVAGAVVSGVQATIALQVGRPAQINASLSVPRSATVSCTLDPRPHGTCWVKARFVSATELLCAFECKAEARGP